MSAPGWYQAPMDPPGVHRWWDGWGWTAQTQHAPTTDHRIALKSTQRQGRRPVAGIAYRIIARAVDFVLAMILASAANRAWAPRLLGDDAIRTDGWLRADELLPTDLKPTVLLATVVIVVVWELYWLLAEGATPGKQLVGLFVSDPTSGRGRVEPVTALKRTAHRAIAVVPAGWAIIAAMSLGSLVLMQNDRDRRQSLMDRFAGTTVFRLPPGSPRFTPWLSVWAVLVISLRVLGAVVN